MHFRYEGTLSKEYAKLGLRPSPTGWWQVTTHTSAAPGPIGVAPVGYSAPPPGAYQGPPPNAGPGIQSAPNPVRRGPRGQRDGSC